MFLTTQVVIIPPDSNNNAHLNELIGKQVYIEEEAYEFREARFRLDQITFYYQSSNPEYIVIKMLDYEHCLLIKDDIRRIDAAIDELDWE